MEVSGIVWEGIGEAECSTKVLFIEWGSIYNSSKELKFKNGRQHLTVGRCPRESVSFRHGVPIYGKWAQMTSKCSEILGNPSWGDF